MRQRAHRDQQKKKNLMNQKMDESEWERWNEGKMVGINANTIHCEYKRQKLNRTHDVEKIKTRACMYSGYGIYAYGLFKVWWCEMRVILCKNNMCTNAFFSLSLSLCLLNVCDNIDVSSNSYSTEAGRWIFCVFFQLSSWYRTSFSLIVVLCVCVSFTFRF